eukprot:10361084-Alexandrium_andersonii.AAC.1
MTLELNADGLRARTHGGCQRRNHFSSAAPWAGDEVQVLPLNSQGRGPDAARNALQKALKTAKRKVAGLKPAQQWPIEGLCEAACALTSLVGPASQLLACNIGVVPSHIQHRPRHALPSKQQPPPRIAHERQAILTKLSNLIHAQPKRKPMPKRGSSQNSLVIIDSSLGLTSVPELQVQAR